jgi:DNA polymerase III subunit beta
MVAEINEARVAVTAPSFTVNRADLVRELALAIGAAEKRTTIPILSHAKLEAIASGALVITSTDLEIAMHCMCAAEVKRAGTATLPAKRLLECVRLLPDGDVSFEFGQDGWATIKAGRSRTRIAGMGAEGFPELPAPGEPICSVAMGALAHMIQRTTYAISMEETRFTLNGALLEISDDGLRMVATDGHRLTLAEAEPATRRSNASVIIQKKAMAGLSRLSGSVAANAEVEISADENHVFFRAGDRILTARKMSGNFPDYKRVIPSGLDGCAVVDRQQFREAVARVRTSADERSHSAKFTLADGAVTIFSSSTETGEGEESVTAEVTGSAVIGLNCDYVLDFLGSTDAEKIEFRFKDAKTSVTFSPVVEGASGKYICVTMPMRI